MRGLVGAQGAQPTTAGKKAAQNRDAAGADFKDVLAQFVKQADQAQHQFDDAIEAVERGETDSMHQVMLAQNQAQLSLRLAAEVRNKLVEAYRDVMRTQF